MIKKQNNKMTSNQQLELFQPDSLQPDLEELTITNMKGIKPMKQNFEKTEITNPNKFDVRISGTSVFVDISIYRIEDSSGIYELKIKKGAKEEVIGGLEESSNLYMETEELVDVEGEKITLTLILNKKQELKNTLFRKE